MTFLMRTNNLTAADFPDTRRDSTIPLRMSHQKREANIQSTCAPPFVPVRPADDMGQGSPERKQGSEEGAAGEQMCKCQESLSTIGFTKLHQVHDVVLASPQSNATIVEPGLRFG